MGLNIPSAAMGMAKRVAIAPLRIFLHLCFLFPAILARAGLLRLPQHRGREGETLEESTDYVLVMDGATPALVHVHVLTSLIKKRVPVVEYGEFLERKHGVAGGAEVVGCAVCLSRLEKRDEMRDLWNCGHVFHRQCLDRWVDLGHVTCPLCRSLLLPLSSSAGKIAATALGHPGGGTND